MMARKTILILLCILCGISTYAQQKVSISVIDKDSRQPIALAYVNVYAPGSKTLVVTTQTDDDGNAAIAIPAFPCIIEVVTQGYEPYQKKWNTSPDENSKQIVLAKKFSSLNEVVVTGLNQPTKLKNALSSYQVISRSQIDALGAVNLGEAMRNQLNISVGDAGILGSNIRMQGMSGDKVKILVDGMPVNGREFGNVSLAQINMNNVERIELIQGPMSVVYGTDAIGGVVNVITKKENKKLAARVNTYYESIGKYNTDAALTFKIKNRHQVTTGWGRNFFDGHKNIDQPIHYNGAQLNTNRAYFFKPNEQYLANGAYSYNATSFKLHFATDYLKETVINKGTLQTWDPWRAYAIDEYYYTQRSLNRLSAEGRVGKSGYWQSQNGYAMYHRVRKRLEQDMVTMESRLTTGTGDQDTSLFQTYTFRGSYADKLKKLQYTVGYDINLDFGRSHKVNGYSKEIQDYALYTNISYPVVADKLTAQAGVRGLHNSTFKAPVIPSFNLLFTPRKDLQVRGSYARGFRAPSLKEMYLSFIDQNHYIVGNPNIKAENSSHVQVSASYQAYEHKADYLQFIVTGFYNNVNNGITLVNTNPQDSNSISFMYHNLLHQSNVIGNAQIQAQWSNLHIQFGGGYNYTFEEKGVYESFGIIEANATLQYYIRKIGVNSNLFYKHTGRQPFIQNNIDGTATYNGKQSGINMLDASVDKKLFNKKMQLTIGVKNILNINRRNVSGLSSSATAGSSPHGSNSTGFLMPRSIFTSLQFTLD